MLLFVLESALVRSNCATWVRTQHWHSCGLSNRPTSFPDRVSYKLATYPWGYSLSWFVVFSVFRLVVVPPTGTFLTNFSCLTELVYSYGLTTAASPKLAQKDCARLTLVRFSSVGRAPTSATQPSVQLDFESGTICRRTSDSRTCHTARFRQSLKMFYYFL